MSQDQNILTIAVVRSHGVSLVDGWGRNIAAAVSEEASGYPEELRPFARTATAAADDGGAFAIIHAVIPESKATTLDAMLNTAATGSVAAGACIARIYASASYGYADDIQVLRKMRRERDTGPEMRNAVSGIEWVEACVLKGSQEEAEKAAFEALMLFAELLDSKFNFADDITRFLAAEREN